MDLEYNLICDFIKLCNELGLSQQKMADESGVVREMIAVIENRKKHPQINTFWNKEEEKYYISVVDIVGVVLGSKEGRKYWNKLKQRLKEEGNEFTTICSQLKLK